MNRKNKIIISIIGITIILLSLIGLTFGYYLTRINPNKNEKSIEVATGNSSVLYTDLTEEIDEIIKPGYQTTKVFTVKNTGNVKATYSIFLIDVFNNFSRTEDIIYTLYRKNGENSIDLTNYSSGEIVTDSKGNKLEDVEFPTTNALVIENEILENSGDVYTYVMVITYKYLNIDQNDDQGHTFSGKINILGTNSYNPYSYDKNLLSYNIINNSILGKGGTIFSQKPETTVAENISAPNEKVLSLTRDDHGTSYYYRGNVIDNYVTFAGMCWRIVRIDGNGNTKLILEDQDEVCSTTMNGNWDIEASDGTNITTDGTNPYRTGNFGYDDSTGKYKMSYLNPVDNPNRAMVNAFKYFQTNTLTNKITSTYTGKTISDFLVSGNWCLNNKAYSDSTGTTLLENPTYTSTFYYDSYVRLYVKTTKEPTLKCPVETMETFGDNTTPMYVGALTADEIVYAGGIVGSNNPNYYLINKWQNSNSKYFWSLSPYIFGGNDDYAFYVFYNGELHNSIVNNHVHAFRPSVSIVSSITASTNSDTATYGQPGTINNPYVIG